MLCARTVSFTAFYISTLFLNPIFIYNSIQYIWSCSFSSPKSSDPLPISYPSNFMFYLSLKKQNITKEKTTEFVFCRLIPPGCGAHSGAWEMRQLSLQWTHFPLSSSDQMHHGWGRAPCLLSFLRTVWAELAQVFRVLPSSLHLPTVSAEVLSESSTPGSSNPFALSSTEIPELSRDSYDIDIPVIAEHPKVTSSLYIDHVGFCVNYHLLQEETSLVRLSGTLICGYNNIIGSYFVAMFI